MNPADALPVAILVEDDPDLALLLQFILAREGYRVELCSDGRMAKARIAQPPPQLVVLDIMLPYIDGFELIGLMRARSEWDAVPILVLTAQSRDYDIARALDGGADDYVLKPFQPEELKARLRRLRRTAARQGAAPG